MEKPHPKKNEKEGSETLEKLSVDAVALLLGISRQAILQQIKTGKLNASIERGSGPTGQIYKVAVEDLPDGAKKKYYKMHKNDIAENVIEIATSSIPFELSDSTSFLELGKSQITVEDLSDEQREQIKYNKELLKLWHKHRNVSDKDKKTADNEFLKAYKTKFKCDLNLSKLYRLERQYKTLGDIGLVDFRGAKNKGRTVIDKEIWSYFEYLYLDENKRHASYCYELMSSWAQTYRSDLAIPNYSTFVRQIAKIPDPIVKLFRYGDKSFIDHCEMYMERSLKNLMSNDIWVADNHTIDVISKKDGTDVVHRLYLTAFVDARSNKVMGINVTDTPNSQSTLIALRNAILAHGKPKIILVDNGREFLTRDIGGRGHRKERKIKENEIIPPTILELLDIKMVNALPRNAKAKIIERQFREFTQRFATLFDTYIGSNPVKKPERSKYTVKDGNIVADSFIKDFTQKFVDGYMNERKQYGTGMNGKTPNEVYYQNLAQKVVVSEAKLNLLLMRTTTARMVRQNGVCLNLHNQNIWFYEESFAINHMNKTQVYLRYDPNNLETVRVYDKDGRFITELPQNKNIHTDYYADNEQIKANMHEKRKLKGIVKQMYNDRIYSGEDRLTALELVQMQIDKNLQKVYEDNSVSVDFEYEEKVYQKAVGGIDEEFEMLAKMAENIKKVVAK